MLALCYYRLLQTNAIMFCLLTPLAAASGPLDARLTNRRSRTPVASRRRTDAPPKYSPKTKLVRQCREPSISPIIKRILKKTLVSLPPVTWSTRHDLSVSRGQRLVYRILAHLQTRSWCLGVSGVFSPFFKPTACTCVSASLHSVCHSFVGDDIFYSLRMHIFCFAAVSVVHLSYVY